MSTGYRLLSNLIISARPRQWLKNVALFAAPFFAGVLFNEGVLPRAVEAFLAFSFLSSAAYLVNDILDRKADQKHPLKKRRPIASGTLPTGIAWAAATILGVGSLFYIYLNFNQYFFGISALFLLFQIAYSLWVRNIIILDALWVATAFVLRVYAGAFIIPTPISSWLVLAVIGLALLLAFGKRRSERTLLSSLHQRFLTRDTLLHYPDTLLDATISMFAAYTALAYSVFAFQTSPTTGTTFILDLLPTTLSSPKWLLLTVPLVIYGLARYLFVIYERKEGESPEEVLISDFPLLGAVLLWVLALTVIIYLL